MGVKAIARGAGALALEISATRVAVALADGNPVARLLLAAGWRKLPDGRYAITPPAAGGDPGARPTGPAAARRALLDALARAT